jgi:hypothetical protein
MFRYDWAFGKAGRSSQPQVAVVFPTAGVFSVQLTVSDGSDAASSAVVKVSVGSAPVISLAEGLSPVIAFLGREKKEEEERKKTRVMEQPTDLFIFSVQTVPLVFRAGQTLTFSATVAPASAALSWTVVLWHNGHTHPIKSATGGTVAVTAPSSGHPFTDDTYLKRKRMKRIQG